MRIPSRLDSSRRSPMPSIFLSRISSPIFSISVALFTWYGRSGRMIGSRARAACLEVGPRSQLDQLVDGDVRVVDDLDEPVHHLAEVVGRDVRGHTDRD